MRAERKMLPKGSTHAVQWFSFRALKLWVCLTRQMIYPPLENEKSFISGGCSPGTGKRTAPRKREICRLVGPLAWHKLHTAPRKRKIFHLVGQFAWNRPETAPRKWKTVFFGGSCNRTLYINSTLQKVLVLHASVEEDVAFLATRTRRSGSLCEP